MTKGGRGVWYMSRWASIYLKHAFERLKPQLDGLDLTIEDVYAMQQLCAFEVYYGGMDHSYIAD